MLRKVAKPRVIPNLKRMRKHADSIGLLPHASWTWRWSKLGFEVDIRSMLSQADGEYYVLTEHMRILLAQ